MEEEGEEKGVGGGTTQPQACALEKREREETRVERKLRRHRRGGQARKAQETCRAFPGDSQLLPGPAGIPSLNKDGSPGRALSAQVRPWRPSQDGQKAQHTLRRTLGYPTSPNQHPRPQATHGPRFPLNRTPHGPQRPRAALTGWRSAAPRRARPPATDACSARWYGSTGSGLDSLPLASRRPPPWPTR